MRLVETRLPGPLLFEPVVRGDARGFFVETYRESVLEEHGVDAAFVQDNHSRSARGVIRGMHFQIDPPADKLVRCGRGKIVDVLVDLRPESSTFGEWESFELDDEAHRLLWVPAGFGHGFCVVSDVADVLYKQTAYWAAGADRGIHPEDPELAIEWPLDPAERLLSERDRQGPSFAAVAAELRAGRART